MIEIFKTNVLNGRQAKPILMFLGKRFSEAKINFDLSDCDKILRVDGIDNSDSQTIITDLKKFGIDCEILN